MIETILYSVGITIITVAFLMVATFLASLYFNDGTGNIKINKRHPIYYMMYITSVPIVFIKEPAIFDAIFNRGNFYYFFDKKIRMRLERRNNSLCSVFWSSFILGSLTFIPSIVIAILIVVFGGIAIAGAHIVLGIWIVIKFIVKLPYLLYKKVFTDNESSLKFYIREAESFHEKGISLSNWIDVIYIKRKRAIVGIVDKMYFRTPSKENHYIVLYRLFYKLFTPIKIKNVTKAEIRYIESIDGHKYLRFASEISDALYSFNVLHDNEAVHSLERTMLFGQLLASWLYANKLITKEEIEKAFSLTGWTAFGFDIPFNNNIKSALTENINALSVDDVESRKIAIKQARENRFAIIKGFYRQTLCPKITIE